VRPAPTAAPQTKEFRVFVGGQEVGVWDANPEGTFQDRPPKLPRVTDPGPFAAFELPGEATVRIRAAEPITAVGVRPKRLGIAAEIDGNEATLRLGEPARFGVEINGKVGRPLMIFARRPDANMPTAKQPGVTVYRSGTPLPTADTFTTLLFPPGVHELGYHLIEGWKDKTVYLAVGAWVRGGFLFRDCQRVAVRGRGVIVRAKEATEGPSNALWFAACTDCTAEDVTVINRIKGWTVVVANSRKVTLRGLNVFSYLGGSDGIDVVGSEDVTLDGCFVCTQDDGIALKSGKRFSNGRPLRNITVRNGVQWFTGLDVGFELWTETVENIAVRNMDFVRPNPNGTAGANKNIWRGVLKVNNGDHARVRNVRFEDIRIEAPRSNYLLSARVFRSYASAKPYRPGSIDGVTFRSIAVTGVKELPPSLFGGSGPENLVANVTIENLTLDGKPVTDGKAFEVNKHTEGIVLRSEGKKPLTLTPKTSPPTRGRAVPARTRRTGGKPKTPPPPEWLVAVEGRAVTDGNLFPGGETSKLKPFRVAWRPGQGPKLAAMPDAWWARPWGKNLPCELSLGPAPRTDERAFKLINTGEKPALMLYSRKVAPIVLSAQGTYAVAFDVLTTGTAKLRVTLNLDGASHELRGIRSDGWQRKVLGVRTAGEAKLTLSFLNGGLGEGNALYLKNIAVSRTTEPEAARP